MKHKYHTGLNLFNSNFISFKIKYNNNSYGDAIVFENINDKFKYLRKLATTKRNITESINIINKQNNEKQKLNKYKI